MDACLNHPAAETDLACARCGRPFCDACLVEFLGDRVCGPCRDLRLGEMQGPGYRDAPFAGTGRVDIGRWLGAGWQIIQPDLFTFAAATLIAGVLSLGTCYILLGPMWCGLHLMCYRKMTSGVVSVEHLFDGFRRFLWAFLAALLFLAVYNGVTFLLYIPLGFLGAFAESSPWLMFVYMPVYYGGSFLWGAFLYGATFFTFAHVAARNANPIDAVSASWQVFRRSPVMFCLAGLLLQLLWGVGFMALCLGALITTPWLVAATSQAYADHFGLSAADLP